MSSKDDERVAELLSEIHDVPSPEASFSRWMMVDIFIIDGLMMAFVILFLLVRNTYVMTIVGAGSIAFGAVYLLLKTNAKHNLTEGRSFIDSQTLFGDDEHDEQISVIGYDYLVLPEKTISGRDILYKKADIDATTRQLASLPIRVGGMSELKAEAVDSLVRIRLQQLKEMEAERRENQKRVLKEEQKLKAAELEAKKKRGKTGKPYVAEMKPGKRIALDNRTEGKVINIGEAEGEE